MRLLSALFLGFIFLLAAVVPAADAGPGRASYREGEVLVQFRRGAPEVDRERLQQRLQGKTLRRLKGDVHHIALPPQLGVKEALAIYQADPLVEYAEPNYMVRRAVLPNDSRFSEQWYLHNSGQLFSGNQRGMAGVDVGAPEAWDVHTGSGAVIVAVLDSGIDYLHPDLAANIWSNPGELANGRDTDGNGKVDDLRGWNFVANSNDPMDDDPSSHGTHIAGIIGALGNNERGVGGINWRTRLMPLKFLAADGSGSVAHAIAAIDYAVAHGARVINASYGYPDNCTVQPPSTFERQAIERAQQAGVLFVAAAGNSGCNNDVTPFYPASHNLPNMLAVTASDARDSLASFSNYGPSSVHLAAPGSTILSTLHRSRGEYGYLSGTSMAAPMVTGVAALFFSYRPELPLQEMRQILLESSLRLPVHVDRIAYGRLDAANLLEGSEQTPLAPGNLVLQSVGVNFLDLLWEDRSHIEQSYELQRRVGVNGVFAPLATLPANTVSYRDETASDQEGTAFFYRVRALGTQQNSAFSNEAGLVSPPLAPQALLADIDQGGVLLTWEDHSQAETGYEVERRSGSLPFQSLALLPANSIDYFDDTVGSATLYTYRLRAFSELAGPSAYSEEANASLSSPSSTGSTQVSPGGGGGGSCFIATAAYGSPLHPKVELLRQFRNEVLLPRWWGRWINEAYLHLSPPLARMVERSDRLRQSVRTLLRPVIAVVEWWLAPPAALAETDPLLAPPAD